MRMLRSSLSSLNAALFASVAIMALLAITSCGSGTAAYGPPPTVSVVAAQATIVHGASTTLTVTITNATSVVISNNTSSTTYTLAATGGTQTVSPTTTTTYTVTASGNGGTVTAQTTVTVTGPSVIITANPTSMALGSSSTLTVTASNATSVVITGTDNTTYTLAASGGTQIVSPSTTTTYTATASGPGGPATAQATVTVTIPPPTVTITAKSDTSGIRNPLNPYGGRDGCDIRGGHGDGHKSTYTLGVTGGTQVVTPTATTTYTATATGQSGTATAQATVTVVPAGTVNSVNHVLFMMQENRTFDTYFGMLNPYRKANSLNVGDDGNVYNVDGIDDKLTTTNTDDEGASFPLFHTITSCLDDMSLVVAGKLRRREPIRLRSLAGNRYGWFRAYRGELCEGRTGRERSRRRDPY